MMKKKLLTLTLILALLTALSACGGAAAGGSYGAEAAAAEAPIPEPAYEEAMETEEYAYDGGTMDVNAKEMAVPAESAAGEEMEGVTDVSGTAVNLSEKIIYTASAEIETTEFDQSVEKVYALIEQYGGFVESSSVTGTNLSDSYAGFEPTRSAYFHLRVPRERYSAMTSALSQVGNVTRLTSDAQNITVQYMDTQSRLSAYQTEEDRLLEILGKAETVEDMITVESRLSDIRYEKEWLTTQLKNWDNQVSYSTVSLNLWEVRELTPEPPAKEPTYWEQVGQGFLNTLNGMGRFAKGLFRVFVAALPLLIPLAVIAAIVVFAVRRQRKKDAEARARAAEIKARAEAVYAMEHPEKPNGPEH